MCCENQIWKQQIKPITWIWIFIWMVLYGKSPICLLYVWIWYSRFYTKNTKWFKHFNLRSKNKGDDSCSIMRNSWSTPHTEYTSRRKKELIKIKVACINILIYDHADINILPFIQHSQKSIRGEAYLNFLNPHMTFKFFT